MIKIMFICLGNICRSPMAEMIAKDIVRKMGLEKEFYIDSAGVSNEEEGNRIYPPAKRELINHSIDFKEHYAKKITLNEYNSFDYIVCMENRHVKRIEYMFGPINPSKVFTLLDNQDIEDPWYSGNFGSVYNQIYEGCNKLINTLASID